MTRGSLSVRRFSVSCISNLLTLSLCLSLICVAGYGQSPTDNSTPLSMTPGSPAGSYPLGDFDTVNLFNGHLVFTLPLMSMGGRGGMSIPVVYRHEQTWRVESFIPCWMDGFPCATYWYPTYNWWNGNIKYYAPLRLNYRTAQHGLSGCFDETRNKPEFSRTTLILTMADGTEYELIDQNTGGKPHRLPPGCDPSWTPSENRGRVWVTADGSSATFISNQVSHDNGGVSLTGDLYMRDGTQYRIEGGTVDEGEGAVKWMRDRNGNEFEFTYTPHQVDFTWYADTIITDSLNRQVKIEYGVNDVMPYGFCDRITYKGFGGQDRIIRISKPNLTASRLREGFTFRSEADLFPTLNGASTIVPTAGPRVATTIWLPDGRTYEFYYNDYYELARVVLPTGGAIEYDYEMAHSAAVTHRRVVEKRIYPNGEAGSSYERKITFSKPDAAQLSQSVVEVKTFNNSSPTPLSFSKHYFYGFAEEPPYDLELPWYGDFDFKKWDRGKEFKTESFDSNGALLRIAEHTWQQRAPISWWNSWCAGAQSVGCPYPSGEIINDPRIAQTVTTLADSSQVTKTTYGYDQYNNKVDEFEYDYGIGAPPTHPVRHTHTDYVTTNPVNGISYDNPPWACR